MLKFNQLINDKLNFSHLSTIFLFTFLPISLILGNAAINLNILLMAYTKSIKMMMMGQLSFMKSTATWLASSPCSRKERMSAVMRFPVNCTLTMSDRLRNRAKPLKLTNKYLNTF